MALKRRPLKITITLDDGLASYLRALCKSEVGIFGDERETIVYALRTFIHEKMLATSGFRNNIIRHLPPDLQKAWGVKK
jgi:hypothetical protein